MKCFYHNDADGRCSAFWVSRDLTNDLIERNSFIEMDYNRNFPMESIEPNELVYIVDYSISPDEMRILLDITKNIIWIDHHKTAIAKFKDFEYDIPGIRVDGVAACMLTYCYLNNKEASEAPLFTKLIADWDIWKFEYGDDTRWFMTAFNAYDFSPLSGKWLMFFNTADIYGCDELIKEGQIMIKFRDGWAREICASKGYMVYFEGYKCFAVNLPNCNSEYFKSIDDGTYDIFIPFSFNGKIWSVSLYSKTVDVSEIAKMHGGGGHKGASGFTATDISFLNKIK